MSDSPRQITVTSSPDPAVVAQGQRITLHCWANGHPYPFYYWKVNGNSLDGANWGTLTITNAKVKDAGNYTCEASNFLGSKESTTITVNVQCKYMLTSNEREFIPLEIKIH